MVDIANRIITKASMYGKNGTTLAKAEDVNCTPVIPSV